MLAGGKLTVAVDTCLIFEALNYGGSRHLAKVETIPCCDYTLNESLGVARQARTAFASKFRRHVGEDNYAFGVRWLLDNNWNTAGKSERRYVLATHELGRVIDQLLEAYEVALSTSHPSS
jgi:hypothetical protein